MRIKTFSLVLTECAQPHTLSNCRLVIDAQIFFYNSYEKSGLTYQYGAECDGYADYLKTKVLSKFNECNIECYFIFKGGVKNLEKKISRDQQTHNMQNRIHPTFMEDIHLQVLDEMGIKYVFTEYEAKTDCIALAKRMSCPVLSFDIEFAFADVQYIPIPTLEYDEVEKRMNCKIFLLNNLLQKFSIREKDKLPFFIVLTDVLVFPENTFRNLYEHLRIPENNPKLKLERLLKWLSKTDKTTIMSKIINHANVSENDIREALQNVVKVIEPDLPGSLAIDYLNDDTTDATAESWFQKGVALNFIAKVYINIYRSKKLLISSSGNDTEIQQTSLNIIKYAYDLLTNFRYPEMQVLIDHWDPLSQPMLVRSSVERPIYEAQECVFENGWNNIVSVHLFQHFMIKDNNFEFDKLEQVPPDVQLLFITLVYLHRKKSEATVLHHGVLLCYVLLSVVKVMLKGGNNEAWDQVQLTLKDYEAAEEVLHEHSTLTPRMNEGLRCSLLEFQLCLQQFNYLNRLCGLPFKPTVYSKTFNATFVYNILCTAENEDKTLFFRTLLGQAPSVLKVFNRLVRLFERFL